MVHKRLLRTLFRALLEWRLLLGKIGRYRLGNLGLPMTNFALALSTTPLATTITTGPTNIRSTCHCGSLVIDVFRNPNAKDDDDMQLARAINCHCQGCRRYHMGAFASFLETDSSKISIRKGRDKIGKFPSNCKELGPVERWFCTDCSSKLLSVPLQDISSLDNTAASDGGGDGDGDNEENDTIDRTRIPRTKCLLNLGPVVEDGISLDVTDSWKEQLERPENNVHWDKTSAVWARSVPNYDDSEDDDGYYDEYPKALPAPLKWSGGCACGSCRYDFILTHPTELQHCYCHLCRELSGSPFMTWIPVENQDFRWTVRRMGEEGVGEEETTMSSSSSPLQLIRTTAFGSRHICRNCKSVMTIVYDEQPDHVWPCAGSLDDSALPKNTAEMGKCLTRVCHICCGYHPTWLRLRDDGMERMEEAC